MHEFLQKKVESPNEYEKGAAVLTSGAVHFHIISEICSNLLYDIVDVPQQCQLIITPRTLGRDSSCHDF